MKIEYIEIDGLHYPKFRMENYKKIKKVRGKFANIKLKYLQKKEEDLYNFLLLSNNLEEYLEKIETDSQKRVEVLVAKIKEMTDSFEELSEENNLKWIGDINNIKQISEEIVMQSLIS